MQLDGGVSSLTILNVPLKILINIYLSVARNQKPRQISLLSLPKGKQENSRNHK